MFKVFKEELKLGNKKLIAKGGIPIPYSQDIVFPSIDIPPPQTLPVQKKLL